jgi:hypothetical protein
VLRLRHQEGFVVVAGQPRHDYLGYLDWCLQVDLLAGCREHCVFGSVCRFHGFPPLVYQKPKKGLYLDNRKRNTKDDNGAGELLEFGVLRLGLL